MSPTIPTELILHTICQLDPKADKSTLSTCALICSTFQIDVQRRLFSSVRLIADFQWDSCHISIFAKASETSQRFLDAITLSPHLASLVYDLELQVSESHTSPDDLTFEHWLLRRGLDYLPLVGQSVQLINILRQLRHLRALSITGSRVVNWHNFEPDIKRALLQTIRHNPLQTISVTALEGFRIGSFYKCLYLRSLTLYDISTDEAIPAQLQDIKPQSIPLTSLILDNGFNGRAVMDRLITFTGDPSCPITLSKLTHLTIFSDDITRVPELLSRCANSLTHLTFSVPRKAKYSYSSAPLTADEVAAVCPPLDLGSLRKLRNLSITKCKIYSTYRPSSRIGSNTNAAEANQIERTKTSIPWVSAVLATLALEGPGPRARLILEIHMCLMDITAHNLQNSVPWGTLMNRLLDLHRDHGVVRRIIFTSGTHNSKAPRVSIRGTYNNVLNKILSNPIFGQFTGKGRLSEGPPNTIQGV